MAIDYMGKLVEGGKKIQQCHSEWIKAKKNINPQIQVELKRYEYVATTKLKDLFNRSRSQFFYIYFFILIFKLLKTNMTKKKRNSKLPSSLCMVI